VAILGVALILWAKRSEFPSSRIELPGHLLGSGGFKSASFLTSLAFQATISA
jgi:hypothetical protein